VEEEACSMRWDGGGQRDRPAHPRFGNPGVARPAPKADWPPGSARVRKALRCADRARAPPSTMSRTTSRALAVRQIGILAGVPRAGNPSGRPHSRREATRSYPMIKEMYSCAGFGHAVSLRRADCRPHRSYRGPGDHGPASLGRLAPWGRHRARIASRRLAAWGE